MYYFSIYEFFPFCDNEEIIKALIRKDVSYNIYKFVPILSLIRGELGLPIHINSGFRSVEHNEKLQGSSSTSQHLTASAVDIKCSDMSALYKLIRDFDYHFGQIILYDKFIHIGLKDCYGEPHRDTVYIDKRKTFHY